MKKTWKFISYLGLNRKEEGLSQLSKVLCNQLNAIIMVLTLFLLIFLRTTAYLENAPIGMGSFRVFLLFLVTLINLILAKKGKHNTSKFLLIFASPVVSLLFPTFIGFVEEENFSYYPFFTTKEVGDGTGLGLSITYNIIKEHEGELFVKNIINGVSFIIKLPLQ